MRTVSSLALLLAVSPAWAAGKSFYAASGKADITPDLAHETTWMAGYGAAGRRPAGVHDPLYARALVVSDGDKTVALVAVDAIGLFREDVEAVRHALGFTDGKRYLFLAATHTHSGPDTAGMWGRFPGVSGVDRGYHDRLLATIESLVRDTAKRMKESTLTAARRDIDPRGLCRDSRDPVVIDPELDVLQFKRAGKSVGTLVRFSCHPEVMGRVNRLLTPDYPGALCARVEEKTGAPCVFFSGVIGGMMTPDVDHAKGVEHEFAEVDRVGKKLADLALAALRGKTQTAVRGAVSFDSRLLRVPVENSRYLLFLRNLVFGHKLYAADGRPLGRMSPYTLALRHLLFFPLPERLEPRVETEVSRVRIGPVEIIGIPGEMLPELAIGGYDGRYRFGHPLVAPDNPNPPVLANAPKGPYLRQKVKAKVGILVGLANDELGYFIPRYDFEVAGNREMAPQPPGTHYEETNSIGPSSTALILKAFDDLLVP